MGRYGEIWGDMGRYGEEDVEMSEVTDEKRQETLPPSRPLQRPTPQPRVPDGR